MDFFEFLKDLNDTAKERLKTPILGAFLLAFIAYNWRPLLLLVLSDASIEDKIVFINKEYCTPWGIIIPLIIATIYTIVVPILSVAIDKLLISTKKGRIKNIYASKTKTVEEKIELAKKEFELKNIETGNKQIEDFQTQISILEQTKDQMNDSHNSIVLDFNKQLSDANVIIQELRKANNNLSDLVNSQKKLIEYPIDYKVKMISVKVGSDGVVDLINSENDEDFFKWGEVIGFFARDSNNALKITENGRTFRRETKKEFNSGKVQNLQELRIKKESEPRIVEIKTNKNNILGTK
ncbi:hypothetical protein [Flavobacterium sp. FlaQc-30]|uniref:hypothetical protein n=1 Tax=Flavobacterium sp. FlaQc-30 TaxID=3374179 RepID=UPI003756EC7E